MPEKGHFAGTSTALLGAVLALVMAWCVEGGLAYYNTFMTPATDTALYRALRIGPPVYKHIL